VCKRERKRDRFLACVCMCVFFSLRVCRDDGCACVQCAHPRTGVCVDLGVSVNVCLRACVHACMRACVHVHPGPLPNNLSSSLSLSGGYARRCCRPSSPCRCCCSGYARRCRRPCSPCCSSVTLPDGVAPAFPVLLRLCWQMLAPPQSCKVDRWFQKLTSYSSQRLHLSHINVFGTYYHRFSQYGISESMALNK
jgi:hypothetical protein